MTVKKVREKRAPPVFAQKKKKMETETICQTQTIRRSKPSLYISGGGRKGEEEALTVFTTGRTQKERSDGGGKGKWTNPMARNLGMECHICRGSSKEKRKRSKREKLPKKIAKSRVFSGR